MNSKGLESVRNPWRWWTQLSSKRRDNNTPVDHGLKARKIVTCDYNDCLSRFLMQCCCYFFLVVLTHLFLQVGTQRSERDWYHSVFFLHGPRFSQLVFIIVKLNSNITSYIMVLLSWVSWKAMKCVFTIIFIITIIYFLNKIIILLYGIAPPTVRNSPNPRGYTVQWQFFL